MRRKTNSMCVSTVRQIPGINGYFRWAGGILEECCKGDCLVGKGHYLPSSYALLPQVVVWPLLPICALGLQFPARISEAAVLAVQQELQEPRV